MSSRHDEHGGGIINRGESRSNGDIEFVQGDHHVWVYHRSRLAEHDAADGIWTGSGFSTSGGKPDVGSRRLSRQLTQLADDAGASRFVQEEEWDQIQPYSLGPKITKWDEQRVLWNEQNPGKYFYFYINNASNVSLFFISLTAICVQGRTRRGMGGQRLCWFRDRSQGRVRTLWAISTI